MNPDSPIKMVEVNGSLKQAGEVNGFLINKREKLMVLVKKFILLDH